MKNNKKQLLALAMLLSCLGGGLFNAVTMQAMEEGKEIKIQKILFTLNREKNLLVAENFMNNDQKAYFCDKIKSLINEVVEVMLRKVRQLDMNTLHTMFALISDCENALLFFVAPPSFLVPDFSRINTLLAALKELKVLLEAEERNLSV